MDPFHIPGQVGPVCRWKEILICAHLVYIYIIYIFYIEGTDSEYSYNKKGCRNEKLELHV